jgi:hypothetical protein
MKIYVEWSRPVTLRARKGEAGYDVDLAKLPSKPGVYIFGRRFSKRFEALYVGKANRMRGRIRGQMNSLRLMNHITNAKLGKRIVLTGALRTRGGQNRAKCLKLAERALIRHFLSKGHDLVNIMGRRIRRHELYSSGSHPKRHFDDPIFLEM